MVRTRNVSQYPGTPPDEGEDRTIPTEQPLYSAQAIAEVLAGDAESRIQPVTHRARQDMEMTCEYYLKWAIGQNGNLLLLVSCHLSRG